MKLNKEQIAKKNRIAIDLLRDTFGKFETLSMPNCEKLISILDRAELLPIEESLPLFEALVEADIRFVSRLAATRLRRLQPAATPNDSAYQKLVSERADAWLPACGGTFKSRSGRTLLYCYNPKLGKHAYLDCDTDIILTDEEAAKALELY